MDMVQWQAATPETGWIRFVDRLCIVVVDEMIDDPDDVGMIVIALGVGLLINIQLGFNSDLIEILINHLYTLYQQSVHQQLQYLGFAIVSNSNTCDNLI